MGCNLKLGLFLVGFVARVRTVKGMYITYEHTNTLMEFEIDLLPVRIATSGGMNRINHQSINGGSFSSPI